MFTLEKAIKEWTKKLRSKPRFEDGDIVELESHLRDLIANYTAQGQSDQEAFEDAVKEMGAIAEFEEEWTKTRFSSEFKQQHFLIRQSILRLFPSYVTSAIRNINKRLGYSILNVTGLSAGLATCLLILFFVTHELSYDQFHEDNSRIFRVINSTNNDGTPTNANGSLGVGPVLQNDFPIEIEDYARLRNSVSNSKIYIAHEDRKFYDQHFYFADEGFLRLFNFPLISGNPENALSRPNTVLITQKMARKYFGNENPIGKTLTADPFQSGNLVELEVTGVLENIPTNTHFDFEFLASFNTQPFDNLNTDIGSFFGTYTYLKLSDTDLSTQLANQFDDFQSKNWNSDPWYTMSLQPLTDIHLRSSLKSEIGVNGNITFIYIFGAVAILILLIACINFINLATARSSERAKEVGVRKVMGAHKAQLIGQFLGEAILMSLISGTTALLLIYALSPFFNELVQQDLNFQTLLTAKNALIYLAGLLGVGILAGIYPAIIISSFQSVDVLKGQRASFSGRHGWLRKTLVISQFTISSVLIICTIIIYQQLNFIDNKSLGFAKEQLLTIPLNPEARERYEGLKSEWKSHSGIQHVTSSSHVPTSGTSHSYFFISGVEGYVSLANYFIDNEFTKTYGLSILAGEDITNPNPEKENIQFMMTELALQSAGLQDPQELIGRTVSFGSYSGEVKGVLNDMILYGLRDKPYGLIFYVTPIEQHKFITIRINTTQTREALDHIGEVWAAQVSNYPLEYAFLDDKFEAMHESDRRIAKAITYFAILAILIACLGLFGLSAYMAERKRKEIGIRKVLGANLPQIIGLLSKDFVKLILIALFIGIPIAWYGANIWLQGFVFKIEIGPEAFVYSALILFLITLLTLSYQSIKSATINPVQSLKND